MSQKFLLLGHPLVRLCMILYTLIYQYFLLLRKPGNCIKKWGFMQSLLLLKRPFSQATLDTYGRIDILINNAGIMPLSFLKNRKVDEWDRMIDVNIKGVLYGIAAIYPHMEERNEGHIINVSSVAGHEVLPSGAVYCGTKFAVRAITEGLRK